jgi:hypothetical protein
MQRVRKIFFSNRKEKSMKKWIPLLIVLVTFIAASGKLLAAKKYGALWTSPGYENLVSAPVYFCDAVITAQPGLF